MWQKIKCPCCDGGEIQINLQALAIGESFPCVVCGAVVSLASESKETVENGVNDFLSMQKKSVNLTGQPSNPISYQ